MSSNNTDRIELDSLRGNRYTIEALKPLLTQVIAHQQGTVPREVAAEIKKLLDGKQSNMVSLTDGSSARLMVVGSPAGLRIETLRVAARLGLRGEMMGFSLHDTDQYLLERHGHLGRVVTLETQEGKPFKGLIGLNHETNQMTVLRVDTLKLPDKIAGVSLSADEKKQLLAGMSVRKNAFVSKKGEAGQPDETFPGFVRLNPADAENNLFHFERILPRPQKQQSQKLAEAGPSQGALAGSGPKATIPVDQPGGPLIEKLGLRTSTKPGQEKGILEFAHGTTALVIAPKDTAKLVVKINLPPQEAARAVGQVFELPLLLSKADAETVVQLARQVDLLIGYKQPFSHLIKAMPEHIRRYLPGADQRADEPAQLNKPQQGQGAGDIKQSLPKEKSGQTPEDKPQKKPAPHPKPKLNR